MCARRLGIMFVSLTCLTFKTIQLIFLKHNVILIVVILFRLVVHFEHLYI